MNFVTHCLEALKDFEQKTKALGHHGDSIVFRSIGHDLTAAMKFLVPSPSALNVKVTEAALKFLRLPYPMCAIEYTVNDAADEGLSGLTTSASTNRIALTYDLQSNSPFIKSMKERRFIRTDAAGIAVISLYQIDETKSWMPSIGFAVLDTNVFSDDRVNTKTYVMLRDDSPSSKEAELRKESFLLSNDVTAFNFEAFPLIRYAAKEIAAGGKAAETIHSTMVNDLTEELAMAVRVTLLLNTKNLKHVKVNDAPEKLNKKRVRANRQPFFSYHTLDIFVSDSPLRHARKKVDFNKIQSHFSSMKTRLHSVTGHFKVRATGIFWWNTFLRGNKGAGVVSKDYNVSNSSCERKKT